MIAQRVRGRRMLGARAAVVTAALLCSGLVEAAALEITAVSEDAPAMIREGFDRQVEIFGVRVYATAGVSDRKLLHAAGILAQYLDNDADGEADNRRVAKRLRKAKAAMVMFEDQDSAEQFFNGLEDGALDGLALQDLYASETHPGGADEGVFDASLEEVLHLITHYGHSRAHKKQFGEMRGTVLAKAMDVARGGYFETVPSTYPAGAWYSYDDATCDYACQVTEYLYWGLTSILGAQSFPGRLEEIEHEWQLNTADKVQQTDKRLWRLLNKKKWRLPTVLPDGDYQGPPSSH